MVSSKRSWEGQIVDSHSNSAASTEKLDAQPLTMATENGVKPQEGPLFQSIFENFRAELDEHHDRREKIIKASRDITALSKKIIFALQRVRRVNSPIPSQISKENKTRFTQIVELFNSIAPDLTGINAWRYQRQISGGIQEFIEALSFEHYIQNQSLITIDEISAHLPRGINVTEEDYVMGIYDLTGEMMRFAVTTLSTGGLVKLDDTVIETNKMEVDDEKSLVGKKSDKSGKPLPVLSSEKAGIVVDLRNMRALLEGLNVPRRHSYHMMRDMDKKMDVMQNSVEKVERAAYGLLVRGSERPNGWTPDLSTAGSGGPSNVEVETY